MSEENLFVGFQVEGRIKARHSEGGDAVNIEVYKAIIDLRKNGYFRSRVSKKNTLVLGRIAASHWALSRASIVVVSAWLTVGPAVIAPSLAVSGLETARPFRPRPRAGCRHRWRRRVGS
mgnify:CR=1 FL=1